MEQYDALEKDKYFLFQQWTEFHARREGYKFLGQYFKLTKQMPTRADREKWIHETEAPAQWSLFREEFRTETVRNQIYLTMQFLGRYSVWNEDYPERFNGWTIRKESGGAMWMVRLFEFLIEHKTLDTMYSYWNDFREVLQENWDL